MRVTAVTPSPVETTRNRNNRRTAKRPAMAAADAMTKSIEFIYSPAMKSKKKKPAKAKSKTEESSHALPVLNNYPAELTTDMVATINPTQPFLDLNVPPQELRPSATLTTGQCFHWKVVHPPSSAGAVEETNERNKKKKKKTSAWGTHSASEFVGTVRLSETESVVLAIQETPTTTLYRPLTETTINATQLHQHMRNYFQLDETPLKALYQEWSKACSRLATIAKCIPGLRIIDQDPWECLVSFICSSNNNIPRITKMLSALRREYGKPLLAIPGNQGQSAIEFYSFPSLNDLYDKATDADLRGKCGMGYRAKYILDTVNLLRGKGGEAYLRDTLRPMTDPFQVQRLLCEFCGVGLKVADCVALFSLQQDDAIPVDTHVWNIALRDYDSPQAALHAIQSLTPTNYQKVGNIFRERFPNRAGWAHSLLFVAELPSFREVLPLEIVEEMEEFQRQEKEKKKKQKK
jgi:N-glycosylase/DNA lyase